MDTTTLPRRADSRPGLQRALSALTGLPGRDLMARLSLTAGAWVVGLIVTLLIVLTVAVPVDPRSTSLHTTLSTANACIAILAAFLIHGRFRRHRRFQDLLLSQGLILLGLAGLGLAWAADFTDDPALSRLLIWIPLLVRALGAVLIAIASFAPARWISPRSYRWRTLWVPLAIGIGAAAVLFALRYQLPPIVESTDPAATPEILAGHPLLVLTEGAAAVLLLGASVAFGLQAARQEDPLFRLLGPAFAFLGFARINFLLYPTVTTQWVYSGDALRAACYGVLLFGAFREVQQYWSAQTKIAVLDDRRRLARELHDGVIQELAFIRTEAAGLAHTQPLAVQVVSAADRGLDEARAALQALGTSTDEPLSVTLHRAAREVAKRYGIGLEVDLDDGVEVTHDQKHALMRITREAVSNAARHGKCKRAVLRLRTDGQARLLVIEDDGRGFDIEEVVPTASGYGLVSMRERAQALPGDLWLDSRPGSGTTVNVRW